MLTLDQLRPGEARQIVRIEGVDGISCRLREMGFVPGESVQFLTAAPLGDPLKCLIQGSRIALRGSEARRVLLADPVSQPTPLNGTAAELGTRSSKPGP